jgi:hypothetical protein
MARYFTTSNGRPVVQGPDVTNLFSNIYARTPVNQSTSLRKPIGGLWEKTPLSNAFFSAKNAIILQNGIRKGVFDLSVNNLIIDPPDLDTLNVIMRSIFIQHSNPNLGSFTEQIKRMNNMVMSYCIQQIYNEARGRIHYLNTVDEIAMPLERPVMTTSENELTFNAWV